jgi:AcrR family transcriptional regulator
MPGLKTSRNAEKSRAAILKAAEELFAELGPDGASLAEIGERAGVSRGLPSYLFSNKAELYQTVLEEAAVDLRSALSKIIEGSEDSPPFEVLAKLTDCYIDYLAAHPSVIRLLQWTALENTSRSGASSTTHIPKQLFDEVLATLAKRILSESHGVSGVRNSAEVYDLLLSVVSICLYPFQVRQFEPAEIKRRKKHVRTFISLLSRTEDE